jgi:hypothetical protein
MSARVALALVVVAGSLAVPAQGQTKIEWKFKEGDIFYVENVTGLKQTMEVLGKKVPIETVNVTVSSLKVLKTDSDGGVTLEQKIEASRITGKAAPPQAALAEQMTGVVMTVRLNPQGEVTRIEGFDNLLKKLSQGNEEAAKYLKTILTEDTMKQSIQEIFAFVPGKPVAKGDSWKRMMTLTTGGLGVFQVEQEFTYEGKVAGGEQISLKRDYRYEKPTADAGLPFKITEGKFKSEEAKGTLLFDAEKGRLVRLDFKSKLKGTMAIATRDQNATMELQQETDTKIRVLDKWTK